MTMDSTGSSAQAPITDVRRFSRNAPLAMVPLFEDLHVDVTGAHTSGAPLILPLCIPELAGIGPTLLDIRAHTVTKEATGGFYWRVDTLWSADGVHWSTPTALFSALSSGPGSTIESAITDQTKMGMHMRYEVVAYSSGGDQSGLLSCYAAFRFMT